jgi:hypothetical protein
VALVGAGVAMCGAVAVAQASQTPSAGALMHTALTNAAARGSVHELEVEKASGVSGSMSDDISTSEGRQDITHSGGEIAHVLVVGSAAYISGNQAALTHYFGFPAAVARKVGAGWVSVPSSSSGYQTIAGNATLSSSLTGLAIPGHTTETAPTTIEGQSVVGIRGTVAVSGSSHAKVEATLYVSRGAKPLPVEATFVYSTGGTLTISLSHWGEKVALSPPPNSIPISDLQP